VQELYPRWNNPSSATANFDGLMIGWPGGVPWLSDSTITLLDWQFARRLDGSNE